MWVITYGTETPRLTTSTQHCAAIIERMLLEEAERICDKKDIMTSLESAKAENDYDLYVVDRRAGLFIRAYWVEIGSEF